MDDWVVSWVPGSLWALLVPVATCALLIYAIEKVDDSENGSTCRRSIRRDRQQVVASTSTSVIVVVEDELHLK